jgi:purine-nucleoside phosphorylase
MDGLPVVIMDGRLHGYEGYPERQITFPIRVMRDLGVRVLVLTNASGGLNPAWRVGDILIIEDHINLMAGTAPGGLGGRTVDRSRLESTRIYDPVLVEQGIEVARRCNVAVHVGVYVAVRGPNYETRAEYRFLRQIGADAVGMSTVPEAELAARLGLRTFALSVVTNVSRPDVPLPTDGATVIAAASEAEPRVGAIVRGVLERVRGR